AISNRDRLRLGIERTWQDGVDGRGIHPGMAGAPIRRPTDNLVLGVLVARRSTKRGFARTEDLMPLLDQISAAHELAAPDDRQRAATAPATSFAPSEPLVDFATHQVRAGTIAEARADFERMLAMLVVARYPDARIMN